MTKTKIRTPVDYARDQEKGQMAEKIAKWVGFKRICLVYLAEDNLEAEEKMDDVYHFGRFMGWCKPDGEPLHHNWRPEFPDRVDDLIKWVWPKLMEMGITMELLMVPEGEAICWLDSLDTAKISVHTVHSDVEPAMACCKALSKFIDGEADATDA